MKREELSEEKRRKYDEVVDKIMQEIAEKNPDRYHSEGQLDGEGSKIYMEVTRKYIDQLNAILRGE